MENEEALTVLRSVNRAADDIAERLQVTEREQSLLDLMVNAAVGYMTSQIADLDEVVDKFYSDVSIEDGELVFGE